MYVEDTAAEKQLGFPDNLFESGDILVLEHCRFVLRNHRMHGDMDVSAGSCICWGTQFESNIYSIHIHQLLMYKIFQRRAALFTIR